MYTLSKSSNLERKTIRAKASTRQQIGERKRGESGAAKGEERAREKERDGKR